MFNKRENRKINSRFVGLQYKKLLKSENSILSGLNQFLAHLWGAYAIPLALSVVRHQSSVVRRVSSVSTITTRNN